MSQRGADFWQPAVTHLLLRLDKSRVPKAGVVLLAATNHLKRVDAALLGPIDRTFEIVPPDEQSLMGILRRRCSGEVDPRCATAGALGWAWDDP